MFPEVEDLRIIVASYVSDDRITLINLFNLWKIPDLVTLSKKDRNPDEKIYYKLQPYIPLAIYNWEVPVFGKNDKNILFSGIKQDLIGKISELENKFEKVELEIVSEMFKNTADFLHGKFFDKITVKNVTNEIIKNTEKINTKHLNLTSLEDDFKNYEIKINDSVQYLELSNYRSAIILSEKSKLNTIKCNIYNENLIKLLNSGFSEKLEKLKISLMSLCQIKNCNFKNLKTLDIAIASCSDGKNLSDLQCFMHSLNIEYYSLCTYKLPYDLKLLPNPETLKHLVLNCKIREIDIPILNLYKNLEYFALYIYDNFNYIIPANVNELIIITHAALTKELVIPKSVQHIKFMPRNVHFILPSNMKFEDPENIKSIYIKLSGIIDDNIKINFNKFIPNLKKLESFTYSEIYTTEYDTLFDTVLNMIPENTINIIMKGVCIQCDTKVIDFRRFWKLRWLEINITTGCLFCDPVILLPTSGVEPIYVDITKNRSKKFKNIRGLYY